ncbi:chorismate synthase [Candidatus Roizmanbacteria bacterium]|nr:chorismate synthase [Candidatus Roizmanbacteria bacterium]
MAGNTFGSLFRVTTFGESHGGGVGCVVDGCPPGLLLSEEDIQVELDRRRPGQSQITSSRKEEDKIKILSGVFEGRTTGTPIMLLAKNKDARPENYDHLKDVYRPSHADYTYEAKYGRRDWMGGGRSSARETLSRVASGAIAKKYLKEKLNIDILSYVESVGTVKAVVDDSKLTYKKIEGSIVRCPEEKTAGKMIKLIEKAKNAGDSVGGVIRGVIRNVPPGLGEPVFDKLSADLGKAMLSINAVKGFELGSGFYGTTLKGSRHNDLFYLDRDGKVRTVTNNSGGIQGGISNGEPIVFRVAFKPVSTISKEQTTLNVKKQKIILAASGRHDPCVLPRAVPVVEAMASLVVIDHYLRHKAQNL